jgi:carbohydrate diacid regulator
MYIGSELAKQITLQVFAVLGRKLLIADPHGQVIAGELLHGQTVPEALAACQQKHFVETSYANYTIRWEPFYYDSKIVGVFGLLSSDKPVTEETIGLLEGLAEVLIHQNLVLNRLNSTEAMRASFVRELLYSESLSDEQAHRQSDILGITLRLPQTVMLIHLDGFEKLAQNNSDAPPADLKLALLSSAEIVCASIKQSFGNHPDDVTCYLGSNTFVLLKGMGQENTNQQIMVRFLKDSAKHVHEVLCKVHQGVITIGLGQYYSDIVGLRKSYNDASLALNVGSKVWGLGKVYFIRDVGMFIALAHVSTERKTELAMQILRPLFEDDQLLKTVRTFLEANLNLTDAADDLHVHRNTLIYRLEKTKKLIGLDPRHFDDALQIKLGLMFYQPAKRAE